MSRKVRDDFEGVIYLGGVALGAGAEIPDDAVVGNHVTGTEDSAQDQEPGTAVVGEPGPELDLAESDGSGAPRGNASLEAWQEYAKSKGATDEDLDGKSRDEVRDQYAD